MRKNKQSQNLVSKTYDLLLQAIESGALNPGRVIVESSIAELIGTSRSPVKAAIALLASEGLLIRFSGRGFIVRTLNGEVDRRPITAETLDLPSHGTGTFKVRSSEKLYDEIEPELVRSAIQGQLRINETDAATHYGVGRSVMHEVLLQAQSNGLIMRDESSRWHTVALDLNRITALYELRMLLEPVALALSTQEVSPEMLEKSISRLEHAKQSYPNLDPMDLFKMEEELHIDCVSACPNREISESLRRTNCLHLASRYVLGNEVDLPVEEPFFQEHLKILFAMQNKKDDVVKDVALRHLKVAMPKVIHRVQSAKYALVPIDLPFICET